MIAGDYIDVVPEDVVVRVSFDVVGYGRFGVLFFTEVWCSFILTGSGLEVSPT